MENQKVRKVLENDQMFNLPEKEDERKVREEVLQASPSIQKRLEDEATDLRFEQTARGEKLAVRLQDQRD